MKMNPTSKKRLYNTLKYKIPFLLSSATVCENNKTDGVPQILVKSLNLNTKLVIQGRMLWNHIQQKTQFGLIGIGNV